MMIMNLKRKLMDRNLKRNISIHNKIAKKYNSHHLEIYNAIEQTRLKKELKNCIKKIHPKSNKLKAFDFGCGTGNVSITLSKEFPKTQPYGLDLDEISIKKAKSN